MKSTIFGLKTLLFTVFKITISLFLPGIFHFKGNFKNKSYPKEGNEMARIRGLEEYYQVHGLELRSKPEVDDLILVELAPDIQDAENHGVHQDLDVHEECDRHRADPVEEQHEHVVG